MHLGDGHIKAKCSWPSAPQQLYSSLLFLSTTPRGAVAASPCAVFFHWLLKSILIFSRITFVALSALWRAFCSRLPEQYRTHEAELKPAVSSALSPHRFIRSLFVRWPPLGVQALHVSSGACSRRIRSDGVRFYKAKSVSLAFPGGRPLCPHLRCLHTMWFIFISTSPASPPSMRTNHRNAACRTNSLKFQFHLTLTIIIKLQSHR